MRKSNELISLSPFFNMLYTMYRRHFQVACYNLTLGLRYASIDLIDFFDFKNSV